MEETVRCEVCGLEGKSLASHLKTHGLTCEQYRELYNKPTSSDAFRSSRSKNASERNRRLWGDPEYREKMEEHLRQNNELPQTKEGIARHNRKPEFIESNRSRLSKLMSETNKRQWVEDYDKCYERFRNNTDHVRISSDQLLVFEFLESLGVPCEIEKTFRKPNGRFISVDLFIPGHDLVIEVNGEYWHGRHDTPFDQMTDLQKRGFMADNLRKELFGEKILFVWDYNIKDGSFKDMVVDYLDKYCVPRIGHVKSGEFLGKL